MAILRQLGRSTYEMESREALSLKARFSHEPVQQWQRSCEALKTERKSFSLTRGISLQQQQHEEH